MNSSQAIRLVVLLLAFAVFETHSVDKYRSVGCFKDSMRSPRPLPKLLSDLRPLINKKWDNLPQIIQMCANLAKRHGHKFFGIEFYGECWSSESGKGYDKDGASSECVLGVGKAGAIQVYELEVPNVKCGVKGMSRIIGGDNAGRNAWPWQAELLMYNKEQNKFLHRCGGTLINPFWVVTAAHCVFQNIDPKNYKIRLGEHDRSKNEPGEIELPVEVIHIHDRFYTGNYGYDIALMKLGAPAIITHAILPACLPTQYQPIELGKTCYVTGWGMTEYGGKPSDILQQARLPLASDESCTMVNEALRTVDTLTMLCAGYGGNISVSGCHGDSGGPFVCQEEGGRWFLRGIVSWGDHKCTGQHYNVFTRVSSFIDWIKCKMNAKPLARPVGCTDAHFYCKQWKAMGFCKMDYFAHLIKGYYCKKTCDAC